MFGCVLVVFSITIGSCLPHPYLDVEALPLTGANDTATTDTPDALTAESTFSPEVTETKQKNASLDESSPRTWMREYHEEGELIFHEGTEHLWRYATDQTEENRENRIEAYNRVNEWQEWKAEDLKQFDWKNFQNGTLKRLFHFAADIGTAAMKNKTKLEELNTLLAQMTELNLVEKTESDLRDLMEESDEYKDKEEAWQKYRERYGRPLYHQYQQFVELSNEGIRDLGFADTGEYWRSWYETPTFEEDMEVLMDQLTPLYQELHAYVRGRLKKKYGEDKFPKSGHIPAHLLGVWGGDWTEIYHLLQPYPNRTAIDVTSAMTKQNYTVMQMIRMAETFFKSLGFESLLPSFWNRSVFEKPADIEMDCHASAWDMNNGKDFRIKMCASVTQGNLATIHHEMGHVMYYMQYRHKHILFRDGANPGFHEAIGSTIDLSFNTPAHLRNIGLLEECNDNDLDDINFLLKMALKKIVFPLFGLKYDKWRWSVFSGNITSEHYNDKWWELRCRYEGVFRPVASTAEDFDPGAMYHIRKNVPYIRYFVSYILQFQFLQALCKAAGHTGPLHKCDIYRSESAGQLLRSVMSKGQSIPWPDVLEEMTGYRKLDAGPILEYFKPLHQWLKDENKRTQECMGWTPECPHVNQ